jgi:serine/threonine-protein kinase
MSLSTGEIIEGKYRIIRLIGEGGMGAVYEGENTRIHRRVAIKVLHQGVAENQEAVQRFEREAQAAGRIGNDHILEVIDMGTLSNGDYFMVMEFLDGEPLSERIHRVGRMRPEDVAPLVMQALEGLQAAHDAGIVHRDLKPDNIFILREKAGQKDFVKLIDFGISKFSSLASGSEMKMTRTGTVMGTPYYMSPEQASGSREADHRSDLYAIGVILYEAVTGRVPFDAGTFNQLLFQIVLSDPAPPQQVVPELDTAFASLIGKSMARDMEHRFQTANELIAALGNWLQSGAAVSVPPVAAANPLVARVAQVSQPLITPSLGTGIVTRGATTPDVWAQPQPAVEESIPKSKSPMLILSALGAVAVLALGFGAYRLLATSEAPPSAAASAVVTSEPVVTATAVAPTPTVAPTPVVEPIITTVTSASATPLPEAPKAAGATKPLAAGKPPAGGKPKPVATSTAKPTPEKPPPTKPTKPAGGSVDFGY